MGFDDKPRASVEILEQPDGWLVVSRNIDGVIRNERFFKGKAEAHAYWLSETGKIKDQ